MIRLAGIISNYEKPFRDKYGKHLLPGHLKAIDAIKTCRTEQSPKMMVQCSNADCAHKKLIMHSCGHRHCPHCQNHETEVWIEKQLQKQAPAEYFMMTFTLPYQFRRLIWYKQRLVYSILFNCVWQTIKKFAANDRQLGGTPGAVAVLHTHSRELKFHPHIHMVMPAATLDHKSGLWANKRGHYLFNHKALAKVFRAKMLHAFCQNNIPLPEHYPEDWVVDCKQVGKGKKALIYLGRYLYRGVIREKDIISCQNGMVTFRFLNSKTKTWQFKTLPAIDFIWMVIQHVLPRGFRRARNYGFMHPNCKRLWYILQWIFRLKSFSIKKVPKKIICPCCGSPMDIMTVGLSPGFHLPVPKPA